MGFGHDLYATAWILFALEFMLFLLYLINLIKQESPRLAQGTKEFRGLTHCLKSPKFVNQPFP